MKRKRKSTRKLENELDNQLGGKTLKLRVIPNKAKHLRVFVAHVDAQKDSIHCPEGRDRAHRDEANDPPSLAGARRASPAAAGPNNKDMIE